MTLSDYLRKNDLSVAVFARRIGVNDRVSVRRYLDGSRIPAARVMRKIQEATDGQVSANDFFDLPAETEALAS